MNRHERRAVAARVKPFVPFEPVCDFRLLPTDARKMLVAILYGLAGFHQSRGIMAEMPQWWVAAKLYRLTRIGAIRLMTDEDDEEKFWIELAPGIELEPLH